MIAISVWPRELVTRGEAHAVQHVVAVSKAPDERKSSGRVPYVGEKSWANNGGFSTVRARSWARAGGGIVQTRSNWYASGGAGVRASRGQCLLAFRRHMLVQLQWVVRDDVPLAV